LWSAPSLLLILTLKETLKSEIIRCRIDKESIQNRGNKLQNLRTNLRRIDYWSIWRPIHMLIR
jgi:hypothetical protein